MLKTLAILMGLLIIVTRGLGVLSPGTLKSLARRLAASTPLIRGLGVFLLIISILIYLAVENSSARATYVMSVIGILSFFGGLWLIILPAQYGAMVDWFMKLSDEIVRVLAGIAVCIGALILILGIVYY